MPKLELTEVERLLLVYVEDACRPLEADAQAQRRLALSKIFEAHGEPLPAEPVRLNDKALEWEKK